MLNYRPLFFLGRRRAEQKIAETAQRFGKTSPRLHRTRRKSRSSIRDLLSSNRRKRRRLFVASDQPDNNSHSFKKEKRRRRTEQTTSVDILSSTQSVIMAYSVRVRLLFLFVIRALDP